MSFLNAALFAGFAAVALPILIHLFSRRRYPLVDFSSLRFLKILQRQQMRKLQIRQWILLLLRTLAVGLIAFAFVRPALNLQSGAGFLTAGRIGAAIVIDGSGSMLVRDADGSAFQKAKKAARELISTLTPGDRLIVILAQDQPKVLIEGAVKSDSLFLKPLTEASAWAGAANLKSSTEKALEFLSSGNDFRSEVYLLSDFTAPVALPPVPEKVQLFFVPLLQRPRDNIAVRNVKIVSEILEPGQPVDLELTLTNPGNRDREDVYYSLYLEGNRVGEGVVTLAAGGEVKRTHSVQPEGEGLLEGLVQIEAMDALTLDNRWYFCFFIPDRVNVLLIGAPAADRELRLALEASRLKGGPIQFQESLPQRWDTRPLGQFDVVIFNDPARFTAAQTQRLSHFVQNGGGVLIFPGDMTDPAAVNRSLFGRLGTVKWGEKIGRPGDNSSFRTWKPINLESPLFKGMFRPGSEPSLPRFYQSITLVGSGAETLIAFSDGNPFLSGRPLGKGRIVICASSPKPTWSDWSRKGIFVPLLHRLMLYLAGNSRPACAQLTVGEDLSITPETTEGAAAELAFPDGQIVKLPIEVAGHKAVFQQKNLPLPGVYRLTVGTRHYLRAVNPPAQESLSLPYPLKDAFPAWFEAGAEICPPEDVVPFITRARFGRELWKIALLAGLAVLIIESLVGRAGKRSDAEPPLI
jgi:hypothetical protein